jgi:hypothetical protein
MSDLSGILLLRKCLLDDGEIFKIVPRTAVCIYRNYDLSAKHFVYRLSMYAEVLQAESQQAYRD